MENEGLTVTIGTARRMAIAGRSDDAARVLLGGLHEHPLMAEARYLLGVIRMAAGDDQAAGVEMKRSLISSPGTAKPWHQLGRLFDRLGDQAGATRQWWRSYSCAPGNDKVLGDLLSLLQKGGKTPRGRLMDWRRRIYSLGDPRAFRQYVDLLIRSGETKTRLAAKVLQSALVDQPSNTRLYQHMGKEVVSPWSPDRRQTFRLRLLMHGVVSADILSNIGFHARAAERYGMAEAYLKRSILFYPARNFAYVPLYFLSKKRGTIEAARGYLCRAWCALNRDENVPGTEALLRCFAELERKNGDTGPLIPRFKKVLTRPALDPTSLQSITLELARCQIEAGDIAGSLENLQTLERLRSNAPTTYLLADWSSYHYRAGDRSAYDRLVDRNFIRSYDLAAIDPDLDIPAFNAALRRRVTMHSSLTLRVDGSVGDYRQTGDKGPGSLLEDQAPELVRLRGYFERLLSNFREELPENPAHPFLKFKNVPAPISLFWGLVNRNTKDIATHRHGDGTFATGIYYAHEAEDVYDPTNPRSGWFEALRSDLNIDMGPADILEFETRPGRFLFLPAYFFHRAMPTVLSRKRVSIVADFNFAPR